MKHIIMDGENDNITIQNVTNTAASTSLNTDGIDWLGRTVSSRPAPYGAAMITLPQAEAQVAAQTR